LIDGDIVGKLVKAGFCSAAIHYFYFGIVDTIDFSLDSNATRALAVPIPVIIGTVNYSKSDLGANFNALHINEVGDIISLQLIDC
jgi:hypothetical protein